jgi:outer membrane protein assembly factor BamB
MLASLTVLALPVLALPALAQAALAQAATTSVPAGDWPTFDYNTQRSGVGPADTGITRANLGSLRRITVKLPGTVDEAPIELAGITIRGRARDVIIVTTSYGRTLALDAASGRRLWEFAPTSIDPLLHTPQITTATPVADPDRAYVYVTTPDGYVHKLQVATGKQVWQTRITDDPHREKLAGSLNIADGELLVVTDGYDGDTPTYQGHIVTIALDTGAITHIFNTLCSNIRTIINPPSDCSASDSAIWGRPGTVIEPDTGDILIATGNGTFNGTTDWGDSVLELSPTLELLHNWTPVNQQQLNTDDWDLGSTEPALLPFVDGSRLAVQAGKEGLLQLLNLNRLDGARGPAGPRTGGQLQDIPAPGQSNVDTQPAVWQAGSRTYIFVADDSGTAAYTLTAKHRLRVAWKDSDAGTSPVVAGGLLYDYDLESGVLNVMNPRTGHIYRSLPAAPGHWNSPIVVGGRVILPVGNDNDHLTAGELFIYHLPGV